jgi:hypothetical protein
MVHDAAIVARQPAPISPGGKRTEGMTMDFTIPTEITAYLAELDTFIEREIKPLERANDNIRFFDHRREWARCRTAIKVRSERQSG